MNIMELCRAVARLIKKGNLSDNDRKLCEETMKLASKTPNLGAYSKYIWG